MLQIHIYFSAVKDESGNLPRLVTGQDAVVSALEARIAELEERRSCIVCQKTNKFELENRSCLASEVPAVVAGIVVGIMLIATISYAFRPYISRSDSEIWEYVNSLPETQAFRERYPDAEGKIWRNSPYYRSHYEFQVSLAATKEIQTSDGRPYARTLGLTFVMGYSGSDWAFLGCGLMPTYVGHVTVYDIRRNECLEP